MKRILPLAAMLTLAAIDAEAQVQINKPVQMTGSAESDRRITGVGSAKDLTDAVNAEAVQHGKLNYAAATGAANSVGVELPVSPGNAYKAGLIVHFKAQMANTGALTLNVNGLGAKPVMKNVNEALIAGDIKAGQLVSVIYDGASFQVISQLAQAGNFSGSLQGDVTGTQNSTLIAPNAVTTAKIANGAVTNDKVANGIDYSKLTGAPATLPPSGAAGGSLSGTYPNPGIATGAVGTAEIANGSITNIDIDAAAAIDYSKLNLTNSIATGDLVNGSVTDAKVANGISYSKLTGAPAALPPSGAAGGSLSGTYPNPGIATGAVGSLQVTDNSITNTDINAGAAIAYSKLNLTNSIATGDLVNGSVTDAKIANGISYSKLTGAPAALPPSGVAGGSLDGNYPNPGIADGTITNADINASAAIAYGKLNLANSIGNTDLTANSVTTSKVADGTVTSAKIFDGTIVNADVSTAAGITYNKLNLANSIATGDLVDGSVTDAKIANGISYSKLSGAPTSLPPGGAAGGDLTGTFPNPTVAANAITTAKIADGTITNADVDAAAAIAYSKLNLTNSLTNSDYTANSITTSKIVDGTVTSAKIFDGTIVNADVSPAAAIDYSKLSLTNSIQNADIVANAITTSKVADGTVTTAKMADDAITSLKMANAAVTTAKIADGAVTPAKLDATGATGGNVLTYDGANVVWAAGGGAPSGAAGGSLDGTYPNPGIADGTITNADINAAAGIAYSKLALTNSIVNGDITANAITTSKVADGTVTSAKIFDGTIVDGDVSPAADIAYSKLALTNSIVNGDITANAITTSKVADGTVTSAKIFDGTIVNADVNPAAAIAYSKLALTNSVKPTDMDPTGASSGDVLTYNGTTVAWTAPAGGGAPSGAAGGSLDGTYPNPGIADGTITNADINAAAAIAYSKLNLTNSLTNSDYTANSITTSKIVDGTVTSAKIFDGTIVNADVSPAAAIAYSKLALTNSVVAGDITANAVTTAKIADGAVTPVKVDATGASSGDVLTYNGTSVAWTAPTGGGGGAPSGPAGGSLSGTYPNPGIASGAVGSTEVADGSITNTDINAAAAIAYSKLALTNSIVNGDITASAITTSKVADGTVTSAKIFDGTIVNTDISPSAAIALSKLSTTGTASASTFLRGDGQWTTPTASVPSGMSVNAMTVGGVNNIVISDLNVRYIIATLGGSVGAGTTINVTVPSASSYAAGTVLTFACSEFITSNPTITITSAGSTYSAISNNAVPMSAISLGNTNFVNIVSDGASKWYRLP